MPAIDEMLTMAPAPRSIMRLAHGPHAEEDADLVDLDDAPVVVEVGVEDAAVRKMPALLTRMSMPAVLRDDLARRLRPSATRW